MDIYLDIDGVLLDCASPLADRISFLDFLLEKFPGRVFWLTTRCNQGNNTTFWALKEEFPEDLATKYHKKIRATNWGDWKTNGINFDEPFVWLDDFLFEFDKRALENHGILDNFIKIDKKDSEAISKVHKFLEKASF